MFVKIIMMYQHTELVMIYLKLLMFFFNWINNTREKRSKEINEDLFNILYIS